MPGINHYIDVIMTTMASQITSLTLVYSILYSDADQRKHQSSASLAFVWGIHRDRWIPRTKGQLRGKWFHLITSSWKSHNASNPLIQSYHTISWFQNAMLGVGPLFKNNHMEGTGVKWLQELVILWYLSSLSMANTKLIIKGSQDDYEENGK